MIHMFLIGRIKGPAFDFSKLALILEKIKTLFTLSLYNREYKAVLFAIRR
jgi:hypothetical protein